MCYISWLILWTAPDLLLAFTKEHCWLTGIHPPILMRHFYSSTYSEGHLTALLGAALLTRSAGIWATVARVLPSRPAQCFRVNLFILCGKGHRQPGGKEMLGSFHPRPSEDVVRTACLLACLSRLHCYLSVNARLEEASGILTLFMFVFTASQVYYFPRVCKNLRGRTTLWGVLGNRKNDSSASFGSKPRAFTSLL